MKKKKKALQTPMFRKRLSIQVKIGFTMILLITFAFSGYGAYQYRTRKIRELARLETFAQNVADQLALNLVDPLWNYDVRQARRVVEAEMQDVNILAIVIVGNEQNNLIAKSRDEDWNITELGEEFVAELPPVSTGIRHENDDDLGTVEVFMTQRFVNDELQQALQEIGAIMVGLDILLFLLLIVGLQFLLIRPLKRLLSFANAMSDGDFQQVFDMRQRDEIGELADSFRRMREAVAKVVKQVQIASAEVSTGSQQLRDSAAKISQGGTQQAASTEEVSASMEEMVANINQNADNAKQTEHIATKASQDAKEGGEAVRTAVEAMKSIAQKISVIEEIANRTHILSMNASIEASKAQEYGKGFAVVATEVRTLASQTQHAAKEINGLATTTVGLAEKAGEMLTRLVPDIQHTAELVMEISAASQEQRSGARQVNMAAQQLDSVSQSYAAASEQAATTAEELAAQAEHLQKMADFFKLPEESTTLSNAQQQSWLPMLEAVKNIDDAKVREQLLLTLGQVMTGASKDLQDDSLENQILGRRDASQTHQLTKKERRELALFEESDDSDDGGLDDDFERY